MPDPQRPTIAAAPQAADEAAWAGLRALTAARIGLQRSGAWQPGPHTSDANRNCISNIRPEGLDPAEAAHKIFRLLRAMRARGLSGVELKNETERLLIDHATAGSAEWSRLLAGLQPYSALATARPTAARVAFRCSSGLEVSVR
jgi:ethanolamine ammonia-lyase light subunit EutC